jgi:hypothetical protein
MAKVAFCHEWVVRRRFGGRSLGLSGLAVIGQIVDGDFLKADMSTSNECKRSPFPQR